MLNLSFVFFTLLYVCNDIKWAKIISNIIWPVIGIINIPLFILSAVFGLGGTVFLYIGPLLENIFSKKGLEKYFGNNIGAEIIDSCMNKGGNLKDVVINSDRNTINQLNIFIDNSNKLEELSHKINNIDSPPAISYYNSYFTEMHNDIGMDTKNNKDSPLNILKELTQLTNNNDPESKQSECSENTYDFWYSKQHDCSSDYTIVKPSSSDQLLGSKTCLYLDHWNISNIANRYNSKPVCSNKDIKLKVIKYGESLNNYKNDSVKIIDVIIKDIKK